MAAVTSAVVGVASVASQAYGAHKAGKAADKAGDAQNALNQQRIDLGREQMEWARGVYDQWRTEFDPMLQELKSEAMRDSTPDYGQISADVGMSFGAARQAERNRNQSYGIEPGDGAFGATDRKWSIAESLGEVNARQSARRDAKNDRFARLASTYGLGAQLQGQAMGALQGGFAATQGAMGSAAGSYGNQAMVHGGNAAAGWAGAWRGLNNMLDTAMEPPPEAQTGPNPPTGG